MNDPPGGSEASPFPPRAPVSDPNRPSPTAKLSWGVLLHFFTRVEAPALLRRFKSKCGEGSLSTSPGPSGGWQEGGRVRLGGPGQGQDWGTSKQSETLDSTEAGDQRGQPGPSMASRPRVRGGCPLGAQGYLL